MKIKSSIYQYFWIILLAFLAACAPAVTPVPSQNPVPTASIALPSSTLTPTAFIVAPTPTPTQPVISIITPDAIQEARWREYENILAQSILPMFPFETILCEWDILARSGQEVYVWAICACSKGSDCALL
jgi:hypothetical protein